MAGHFHKAKYSNYKFSHPNSKGPYIKDVRTEGGGSKSRHSKGFTLRDLAKMRARGEGVQKPENFADVLYVWPLGEKRRGAIESRR